MSKINIKIKNTRTVLFAFFTLGIAAWTAMAAPQASSQGPKANSGTVGEVRLEKYVILRLEPPPQPGIMAVSASGQSMKVLSPRYQMVTPRIRLTLKNGRVLTGNATGGVQVTVKDDVTNQTTQLTCDSAVYTAGAIPNRGRIDLKGNVKSKTYSPGLAEPLVSESESGFIEFTGNSTPTVQLNNGSASFTLKEPPAEPAKKP
jgi:hypothetical protein